MKRVTLLMLASSLIGCATIAGGGTSQVVNIGASSAPDASVTVKSSSGLQMVYKLEPALVTVSLVKTATGGDEEMFSVVRFLDKDGELISEKVTKMVPAR